MQCAAVQTHLDAYVDGEITPLTRWRMARHLRGCPACARELKRAALQRDAARRWLNVSAPQHLRERLASALSGAQPPTTATQSALPLLSLEKSRPPLWYRVGLARLPWIGGLAAVLLTVCLASLRFFVPNPAQRSLNQVQQHMQQTQTAHWTLQLTIPEWAGNGVVSISRPPKEETQIWRCWARTEPPAIALQDAQGVYYLINSRSQIPGVPDGNPFASVPGGSTLPCEGMDLHLLYSPAMLHQAGLPVDQAELTEDKSWNSEQVILQGRLLDRFSRQKVTTDTQSALAITLRSRQTLLADPHTHLVVSAEDTVWLILPDNQELPIMTLKMQDFEYNIPIPTGLFDAASPLYRSTPQ